MANRDKFNEATRVQMPALVHLNRLGYDYFGKISEEMANTVYDPETNILIDVFKKQFVTLNPDHSGDAEQVLRTIRQELDNDDLGRSFYKRLTMTIDILIVFNMLLTGFDAPRLKRLYFGRKLKDHNLLQAITRVNRPYKDNRYGFVIDFADIKKNFQDTNEEYLRELNRFNDPEETGVGNETDTFQQVLEDPAALIAQMQEVRQALFEYSTDNAEEFSSEISTIEDKTELLKLKKALIAARDCCNMVRTFGDEELKAAFAAMELPKLTQMISEVQHHIDAINQNS